jgi:hypothetical protein
MYGEATMPKVRAVRLSPPPSLSDKVLSSKWTSWLNQLFNRVEDGPFKIQGYPKADLINDLKASDFGDISSTDPFSSIIFVYDEVGGPVLAFSDGTDWRRVTDRSIVA